MIASRVPTLLTSVQGGSVCFRINGMLPLRRSSYIPSLFSSPSPLPMVMVRSFSAIDEGTGHQRFSKLMNDSSKPTLSGTVEEYFDLIRGRALGYGSPQSEKPAAVIIPRSLAPVKLGHTDALVLSLIKELWPELATTQVGNQINPQRLCINVPSPLASFIRPYSIHSAAEALTIITYLDEQENLRLGFRWWFYTWTIPLRQTQNATLEDLLEGKETTEEEGGRLVRSEGYSHPLINSSPSKYILAGVSTLVTLVRGIIEGRLKIRSEVWLDRDMDQRLVRSSLVSHTEENIPSNSTDFESVLSLSWNGASFSTAEGKPFLTIPTSKQNEPFVLTPTPSVQSPSVPTFSPSLWAKQPARRFT